MVYLASRTRAVFDQMAIHGIELDASDLISLFVSESRSQRDFLPHERDFPTLRVQRAVASDNL